MSNFDLVVIGCGPAGLSAMLWASELGLNAVALEAGVKPGGQLLYTYNRINNHLGSDSTDGKSMLALFEKQLSEREPDIRTNSAVKSISGNSNIVVLNNGSEIFYKALLIATGVRRRILDVDGEAHLQGKGILRSAKKEAEASLGKRAIVVGGGDAAFENALLLSEYAEHVTLIHRRQEFSARAEFQDEVGSRSNIEIVTNKVVKHFNGAKGLNSVTIHDAIEDIDLEIEAQIAIVRIGVTPNSELAAPFCETDIRGYLKVDRNSLTTSKYIYAAGDVANPNSPTISTAVGMATTAVKTIRQTVQMSSKRKPG